MINKKLLLILVAGFFGAVASFGEIIANTYTGFNNWGEYVCSWGGGYDCTYLYQYNTSL